jgi:fatty-acyl-CoA synthase
VRGSDGLCIECKNGEKGEMMGAISTQALREFPGYTDKSATEKKVARDVVKKGDSWFRTGDLLYKDKDGFIFFVDRIGDTFRWKGENVATK